MIRFFLFCICLFPQILYANNGFSFRYVDMPLALRDGNIKRTVADRKGILWFSTSDGLNRYDGNHVLHFDLVSKPNIVNNNITTLFPGKDDVLWVGTTNGITKFDLRSWTTQHFLLPDQNGNARRLFVRDICEDPKGRVYICTDDAMIYTIEKGELKLVMDLSKVQTPSKGQASLNGVFMPYPGELWALLRGRLLRLKGEGLDYKVEDWYEMPTIKGNISRSVYFSNSGDVLFFAEKSGLYHFHIPSGHLAKVGTEADSGVHKNRDHFIPINDTLVGILANRVGVYTYNVKTRQLGPLMEDIAGNFARNRVMTTYSADGKTYLTSSNGIMVMEASRSPFRNILERSINETNLQSIRSIYQVNANKLYLGSYRDGFLQYNLETSERTIIMNKFVYSMLRWDDNRLLLATEGDGLQWLDTRTDKVTKLAIDTTQALYQSGALNDFTVSLCRESDSTVWVGSYFGVCLLNVYTGKATIPWQSAAGKPLNRSRVFDIYASGRLRFFSSMEGAFVYDTENGRLEQLLMHMPGGYSMLSIYFIRKVGQEYWLGTNGRGLLVLNERLELMREKNTSNGLAGNAAFSFSQVGVNVFIGTNLGLTALNLQNQREKNYYTIDHLPSNEFNHSATFTYGNIVYLGTINGITSFNVNDLQQYRASKQQTNFSFTSFILGNSHGLQQLDNLPYQPLQQLEVPAGTRYFSIRFGSIDDALAQQTFYYRLHETDSWQEIGRYREISFAGIQPGYYNLQVATSLPGENIFHILAAMPLHILPNFYDTWWFRLACVLCIPLIAFLVFRYRVKQMKKEQKLRTQIAGDLHDEVGSTLTRIYFQADLFSMRSNDKASFQQIASASKDALGLMSDLVWSIDARFDTAHDLVARLRDYVTNLQDELETDCTLEIAGNFENRELSQATRQNFFLIFKEAINNAARYSTGCPIKITLQFCDHIQLSVQNNYDATHQKMKNYQGGQGLQYMQIRAAKMKGDLRVDANGQVFIVKLSAPF
ncbi:two component regulator with propeller domain [Chitinophaga skermanii]|uniref:histidine kinase n=1 Tax=Chitinophaga skermanii TaxID=331697 RepID=A0A327QPH9_9BACT|nr:two-component regulator propeller domain-containing protein [Chitinophaga skermanii]RAJ06536.1 two component regulator with propeller domain [Chitinophaga skermanii]